MLRAVHEFPGTPVLGLNLGGLGYLSSVGEGDFGRAVEMLARGEFKVAERSALAVRKFRRGAEMRGEFKTVALNDVVVMREMSGHAAMLDMSVDAKRPTRYLADGIVVATPTGSTAYSLSAGGPVLMPDSGSFVVTPMNPHALGIRPLVVGDGAVLSVSSCPRTDGEDGKIGVYADGENVFMLEAGEVLEISKSPDGVALVELDGYDPYEVLARKLGWSGSCVHGGDFCGEERK
jgi:NAD+ kinase